MKTKKVEKVITLGNNHTEESNWSSFNEAPYRNPDLSQQP